MPSIISRAYVNKKRADAVKEALLAAGFRNADIDIAAGKGGHDVIAAARLGTRGAAAAMKAVDDGQAVLVARAPFGTAQRAAIIVDAHEPLELPGIGSDLYVLDNPKGARLGRILPDHRLFLTRPYDVSTKRRGLITPEFGAPVLKARSGRQSAWSGTHRMSRFFWPAPLVSKKKRKTSAWSGTHRMSRFFWPMPLVMRRRSA